VNVEHQAISLIGHGVKHLVELWVENGRRRVSSEGSKRKKTKSKMSTNSETYQRAHRSVQAQDVRWKKTITYQHC
jgi:hypothetical protein